MSACECCGYDPENVGTRYELDVQIDAKATNGRTVNAGASRWAYKHLRKDWAWAIAIAIGAARAAGMPVPEAKARRRLIVTRFYAGLQRPFDGDNIATFYKPAIDELVAFKLLVDDSPKWVNGPFYRQEAGSHPHSRFVFQEIK